MGAGWEVYLEGVTAWAALKVSFLGCPIFPSPGLWGSPFCVSSPGQGSAVRSLASLQLPRGQGRAAVPVFA